MGSFIIYSGDKMSNRTVELYTVIYCLLCCHPLRDHMLAAMHVGLEVATVPTGRRPAKLYCTGPESVNSCSGAGLQDCRKSESAKLWGSPGQDVGGFRGLGEWGEILVKNR